MMKFMINEKSQNGNDNLIGKVFNGRYQYVYIDDYSGIDLSFMAKWEIEELDLPKKKVLRVVIDTIPGGYYYPIDWVTPLFKTDKTPHELALETEKIYEDETYMIEL